MKDILFQFATAIGLLVLAPILLIIIYTLIVLCVAVVSTSVAWLATLMIYPFNNSIFRDIRKADEERRFGIFLDLDEIAELCEDYHLWVAPDYSRLGKTVWVVFKDSTKVGEFQTITEAYEYADDLATKVWAESERVAWNDRESENEK